MNVCSTSALSQPATRGRSRTRRSSPHMPSRQARLQEVVKRQMVQLDAESFGPLAGETPPLTTSAPPRPSCSSPSTGPRDSFRISTTLRRSNISEPTGLESQRRAVHVAHHSPIPGTTKPYRPGPTHPLPLSVLRRTPDLTQQQLPTPLHGVGAIPRDFFKTLAKSIRAEREALQSQYRPIATSAPITSIPTNLMSNLKLHT
jgi:hypothetical protein